MIVDDGGECRRGGRRALVVQIVELGRGGDGDDEECEDARSDHILSYEYDAWGVINYRLFQAQQHLPKCIIPKTKLNTAVHPLLLRLTTRLNIQLLLGSSREYI